MEWTDEHDVLILRKMVDSDVGRSALSMRNSALYSAQSMLSRLNGSYCWYLKSGFLD